MLNLHELISSLPWAQRRMLFSLHRFQMSNFPHCRNFKSLSIQMKTTLLPQITISFMFPLQELVLEGELLLTMLSWAQHEKMRARSQQVSGIDGSKTMEPLQVKHQRVSSGWDVENLRCLFNIQRDIFRKWLEEHVGLKFWSEFMSADRWDGTAVC